MKDFERIYFTGDIHTNVVDLKERIFWFEKLHPGIKMSSRDVIFILGDAGFEFYSFYSKNGELHERDVITQKSVKQLGILPTLICVQGNHEVPVKEMHGKRIIKFGAKMVESNGIYFVENGEVININGKTFLAVGGAYSVDKFYRLQKNAPWWKNEQLNFSEMKQILQNIKDQSFDFVLTHTCPTSVTPVEAYLKNLDQKQVDVNMEKFLEVIKNNIQFKHWFCGHWHINKNVDNTTFLFDDFVSLSPTKVYDDSL